jgi:hypothetical protein
VKQSEGLSQGMFPVAGGDPTPNPGMENKDEMADDLFP